MTDLNRRTALCLLGSGLSLAIAGCSDSTGDDGADGDSGDGDDADGESDDGTDGTDSESDGGDSDDDESDEELIPEGSIDLGDLPAYASALPNVDDEEGFFFGAIDAETLELLFEDDGEDDGDEGEDGDDDPEDPLLLNPLVMVVFAFFVLLALGFSEFAQVHDENDRASQGEGYVLFAGDTSVIVGEYDLAGVRSGLADLGYEAVVDESDRVVYYDDAQATAIGATSSLFAFTSEDDDDPEFDPVAAVERIVDAATGAAAPRHETDEDFETLLRAGTGEGVVLSLYTDDEEFPADELEDDVEGEGEDEADDGTEEEDPDIDTDFDPFRGAKGLHQSIDVLDADQPDATAIVQYASEDRIDAERLTSALGTEAEEVTFVRDGALVRVDAIYATDDVEGTQSSLVAPVDGARSSASRAVDGPRSLPSGSIDGLL